MPTKVIIICHMVTGKTQTYRHLMRKKCQKCRAERTFEYGKFEPGYVYDGAITGRRTTITDFRVCGYFENQ